MDEMPPTQGQLGPAAPYLADNPIPTGAVVDVSNVCWSERLPPLRRHFPLLDRLELVCSAWRRRYGADSPLVLVADNSLRRALLPEDARAFRRMERVGQVRTAPTADPVLLELARDRGWHVISEDQFKDLRRLHPWIERSPSRFLSWELRDGEVRLRPSGIRRVPAHAVSLAVERKDLKHGRHIDPSVAAQERVLRSHWRCTARGCVKAFLWPDRLLDWPSLARDGTVVCSCCGFPLEEAGPRGTTRLFVASDARTGTEFLRFPISLGSAVQLGRGDLTHGVNLAATELRPPEDVRQVSRRHLMLSLEESPKGPLPFAVDLGSGNGTLLTRGTERRLDPGERIALHTTDRLVLGDAVAIRLSGRRYITPEEEAPPSLDGAGGGLTVLG
ncbi:FHA domain-containing protein [Kitasatospora aureofaciens]|uniref:FHA domain-containing protein n=1 Tax=Kitasatospora aureofaciens TaxID=1894 RepID=UPI001C474884|nr:FHA domain-containing protein [Kitasatospora aureofaciens]MBV6700997.1 FHA domain-containing protein [Kitasatospora aureofaciens]